MTPAEELALRRRVQRGDARAELQLRRALQAKQPAQQREVYGEPVVRDGQFQVGGPVGVGDVIPKTAAVAENTAALVTGAAAQPIAGLVGLGQTLNPMAPEGAGARAVEQVQSALTYQPRTARGQENQAGLAETLAPVTETIDKARFGDEAIEAGADPALATIYEMTPELLLTPLGLKSLLPKKPAYTPPLRQSAKTGELRAPGRVSMDDGKLQLRTRSERITPRIDRRFDDAGNLIKTPVAKKAVESGWAEKTVRWANTQPKRVRNKLRDMIDDAENYFSNQEAERLPSDVIGESASQRLQFVNGVRARAGRVLDAIAEGQLAKKRIDIAKLQTEMRIAIRKLGGDITPEGVKFGEKSKLWRAGTDQQALIDLDRKLQAISRMPTGKELHDLKQWIDTYISTRSPGAAPEGAISAASQRVLEKIRRMANDELRKASPAYKKANDTYSETRKAIDTLQKGAGNIDMFGDGSIESIGQSMRRVLSNAQSRTNMKNGIHEIGRLAEKYSKGDLPYESYVPQMRFLSEMEKLWGGFKEESLKGNLGQSAQRMAESPSAVQGAREVAGLTAKQIRKAATSRERQIRLMKELLYQGGE